MNSAAVGWNVVYTSVTIMVLLSTSPFNSVNICFICLDILMLGTYIIIIIFLVDSPLALYSLSLLLMTDFDLKSIFV